VEPQTHVVPHAEIGSTKILGVFWLLTAIGFVAVGAALLAGWSWWWRATLAVASVSLVLSVLWVHQAFAGIAIEVVIIGRFLFSQRARGLASRRNP